MVDVLAIRVTTVVASVMLGKRLPARACRGSMTGALACTQESGSGSAPQVARCVTAAWHERDSASVTAAFHGCRSAVGAA
jgi:hypothetical protein